MIYDLLENIGRYRGICPNLDTAIRFLMDTDLNTLPTGKTEIDGDRVYLQIMDAVTHELTEDRAVSSSACRARPMRREV